MNKPLEGPKHGKAFWGKSWQLLTLFLALTFASHAQDSAKYSRIQGFGFGYKRFDVDSLFFVPLFSSPHVPYRQGALKYNPADSSLYLWTGFQWRRSTSSSSSIDSTTAGSGMFLSGHALGWSGRLSQNATISAANIRSITFDSTTTFIIQNAGGNTSFLFDWSNPLIQMTSGSVFWRLRSDGVLVSTSTSSSFVGQDSTSFSQGKMMAFNIGDSLMVRNLPASTDTTKYKPIGVASNGRVAKMGSWPGGGGSGGNLDSARSAFADTVKSPGFTPSIIKLVDKGSNKAGLISPITQAQHDSMYLGQIYDSLYLKRHIDSVFAFTKHIPAGNTDSAFQYKDSVGGGSSTLTNTQLAFGNASNAITSESRLVYDSVHMPGFISSIYTRRLTIAGTRANTSIGPNDYFTAKFIGPYIYIGDSTFGEPTGIDFGDPYGASQGTPMRIHFGWGGTEEGNWWINAHYPNGTHTKYDPAKIAQWIAFNTHYFACQAWGTDGSAWNGSGSKTVWRFDNIEGAGAVTGSILTVNGLKVTDPSTSSYDNTDGTYMQMSVNSTIGQFNGNVSAYQFLKPLSSSDATPGSSYTSYLGQTSFTIPSGSTLTDPFVINNQSATKPGIAIFGSSDSRPYSFRIGPTGKAAFGLSTATAWIHISAGTASANTAPLKFTSGTLLTTPENGAIEYDGSHYYGTAGGTRFQLDQQSGTTPNWETVLNQGGALGGNNSYRVAGHKITLIGTNGLTWEIKGANPRTDWVDTVNTLTGSIQMTGGEFNISSTANIIRTNSPIFTVNASNTSTNYDFNIGGGLRSIIESNPHSLTEPNLFWNKVATGTPDQMTVYRQDGNYAMAILNAGTIVIGSSKTNNSTGQLQIGSTSAQLALHYDNTHYSTFTTSSSGNLTITPSSTDITLAATNIKLTHIIGQGSAPTTSVLGTNVTSATITGTDNDFQMVVVTSGNVNGTICTINWATAWASAPLPVFSPKDAATGIAASQMWCAGLGTTTGSFGGTLTGAGTYTFNFHVAN